MLELPNVHCPKCNGTRLFITGTSEDRLIVDCFNHGTGCTAQWLIRFVDDRATIDRYTLLAAMMEPYNPEPLATVEFFTIPPKD